MAGHKFPKHVWSPAGGWYGQPNNWKSNTFAVGAVVVGITAMAWNLSANRETRTEFPLLDRFYPSRFWSKQVIAHEKEVKGAGNQ